MRAEAPEPSIRGSYLTASRSWIYKTYGHEVFDKGVQSLSEAYRATFRAELVGVAWYPLAEWTKILAVVRGEVFRQTGETEATFDRRHMYESISGTMQTVYRIVFGIFSAPTIVAKVTPYFKKVYSHGEYQVVTNEPGRCLLRFVDAPVEMLPELERSFPLAASWMLDVAGQVVTRKKLTARTSGHLFSCDLALDYVPKKAVASADQGGRASG